MRALFLVLPMVLSACTGEPKAMYVDQAEVRLPAVKGNPGAAYFTLHGGAVDERLMSVSSPLSVRAEMHDMKMAGGMMKMEAIEGGLAVPANDQVEFRSGGKHVMLFDISPKVSPGDKMPLTLTFASGTTLSTEARAVGPGGK